MHKRNGKWQTLHSTRARQARTTCHTGTQLRFCLGACSRRSVRWTPIIGKLSKDLLRADPTQPFPSVTLIKVQPLAIHL